MFNRKRIEEQAQIELNRISRNGGQLSLIAVDLDDFKQVNDQFGHPCGDHVLRKVSRCLQNTVRKTDFVGRMGGEEFLLLLPQTQIEDAIGVAENLRKAIASLHIFHERYQGPHSITASFGVSASDEALSRFEALYSASDEALYAAKQSGKNCVKSHIAPSDHSNSQHTTSFA